MKPWFGAVAAGCIVAVAILLLSWTTYFEQFNSAAYDFTLRLAGPISPSSPTVIVAIDDDSLAKIGSWPWSRDNLARLIERIQTGMPKTIAIDVLLDDERSPQEDAALVSAIANAPNIVLAARLQGTRWRRPHDAFVQKHVRLGHVHADQDFDTVVRRVFSAKIGEGRAMNAFSLETLRSAGLQPSDPVRAEAVNIRFAGDNKSFLHLPAWQVFDPSFDTDRFKDRMVLLGITAAALGDDWFTPFALAGEKMSGVEIHANAIETFFAGRAIREVHPVIILLALISMIVLLWWMDRRFEGRRFYAAAVALGPAVFAIAWLLMKSKNVWFPFPPFWAAVVLMVPGLEVAKLVRVNRDLDAKIRRLSGWLGALGSYEPRERDADRRSELFGSAPRNARWKLDAIDFFNEELMRFLSFNNAVLASIEDVIIVSDPAGRVVYQNPAARRLEGFTESPGESPVYAASLLDGRDFTADFSAVLAKDRTVTIPFVPARSGKNFYNVTLSPISGAGVVLSMHDATAQYELNQAKSDMVSLVSHELRTPLTSIRGYSDMLLKYGLVQEKGKEFLGTIIDESARLNRLIQSFLDIAYIESGRQKVSKSDFEIAPVLKDMFSVIGPLAADKQINLEGPADLNGMQVSADRLLLYQALSNLVSNAIKYSPPGTTVRVGVSNGNGRIRFQVADEGYGIPADEAGKIFEKFYRRGNKETREQTGFGLGLAFVKEVAARHGGDVIVESEVGKGSVFTLWLPTEVRA